MMNKYNFILWSSGKENNLDNYVYIHKFNPGKLEPEIVGITKNVLEPISRMSGMQ